MKLHTKTVGKVLVITATGQRIDAAVAIEFKDNMRKITEFAPELIDLNLAAVDFIDSSGLGAVVAAFKQLPANKTLRLVDLTPTVAKVFRLTRMDSVFEIRRSAPDQQNEQFKAS